MKRNIEEVKEIFSKNGLILLSKAYNNSKEKMKCVDNNGYYYSLSLGSIIDKRNKGNYQKVGKNNPYSIENMQHYIELKNSNTKIISNKYKDEKEEIVCECECGNIFSTTWNHIYSMNKLYCNQCGINRRTKLKTYTVEFVKKFCEENGYLLLEDTYIDAHNFAIQDKEGYRYKTTYYNIKNSLRNFDKFDKFNPYTIYNICNYISINNLPTDLCDKTLRQVEIRKDYLEFICGSCGNVFISKWNKIMNGNCRCPICVNYKSNLEHTVEQYLKENKIDYICQKCFDDCKNKRKLPFDFYLKDYNTVIEVQGQQHYYENRRFSQSLDERKRIDKIKKDYCIENNINYIEMPFWYINNKNKKYKEIINDIIN